MSHSIDHKDYAERMRKICSLDSSDTLKVSKEFWLEIADIIEKSVGISEEYNNMEEPTSGLKMNSEWIKKNLIDSPNGVSYQNRGEIDSDSLAETILMMSGHSNGSDYIQELMTPHWKYILNFNDLEEIPKAIGKWWLKGSFKDFEEISKKGIEEKIFCYTKIKISKGMPIICFYTKEKNIVEAAKFLEPYISNEDGIFRSVNYKTDEATLSDGKSSLKIEDVLTSPN